jgi:hypothetical protein
MEKRTNRVAWALAVVLIVGGGLLLGVLDQYQRQSDLRLELWRGLIFLTYARAKELLDKGVSADDRGYVGQTPLMVASEFGLSDTVRILLMLGANVNARDNHGNTALVLAERAGHTKLVKQLRVAGAQR